MSIRFPSPYGWTIAMHAHAAIYPITAFAGCWRPGPYGQPIASESRTMSAAERCTRHRGTPNDVGSRTVPLAGTDGRPTLWAQEVLRAPNSAKPMELLAHCPSLGSELLRTSQTQRTDDVFPHRSGEASAVKHWSMRGVYPERLAEVNCCVWPVIWAYSASR